MTDTAPAPASRPTSVKAARNGPAQLNGTCRLQASDGEDYHLDGQRIVLLSGCGKSMNQPFRDSSHVRVGITSGHHPAS
jgi:CDGSH-type Zn-finger protein